MKKKESQQFTLSLMETTPAVYLATVDEQGFPHIRALTNLRDKKQFPGLQEFFKGQENPFITYLSTFSTSEKAKHIRHNPHTALYFSQPERFFGVMLSGSIEITRDKTIKEALWQKEWLAFWPKGPSDPRYRVYRFIPDGAKGWNSEEIFKFIL